MGTNIYEKSAAYIYRVATLFQLVVAFSRILT